MNAIPCHILDEVAIYAHLYIGYKFFNLSVLCRFIPDRICGWVFSSSPSIAFLVVQISKNMRSGISCFLLSKVDNILSGMVNHIFFLICVVLLSESAL